MYAREGPTKRYLSVDEWRELLGTSDVKYEYHHGWVYAMAGETADHSSISINAVRALQDALGNRPCRAYNSDMAVRLAQFEYRFPDATVTGDPHDRGRITEVQSPRVIVEVLSDSTETEDRTYRFALARACPSVQEYVLIATRYQTVEVYHRGDPAWLYRSYGPGENVELESIDASLPVDQLYRLTEVPLPGTPEDRPEHS